MLSKSEILYLQGQKQISKSFEYKLKHSIRKKVALFLDNELPLLESNHVLDLISIKSLGKAKVADSIPAQGFLSKANKSQFEVIEEEAPADLTLLNSIRNGVRGQVE